MVPYKNSTWRILHLIRLIRHPEKMVPCKNGTPCEKIPKGYLPKDELSDF